MSQDAESPKIYLSIHTNQYSSPNCFLKIKKIRFLQKSILKLHKTGFEINYLIVSYPINEKQLTKNMDFDIYIYIYLLLLKFDCMVLVTESLMQETLAW